MKKIVINGGRELNGKILLQGSKNSALPILAATIAVDGVSIIHNCPDLTDITATHLTAPYDATRDFTQEPTSGTIGQVVSVSYGNDATAKQFGYTHRVGTTEGGKPNEVYFTNEFEALAQAPAGTKVYNITGATPVEVVKTCEHTFTDTVVAPTCTEEGYTKHTCSLCGDSYNDTTVAATGHDYAAATCTKKATCTVCNAETGELARHKYGVATCTKKAACSVCGAERGELAKHVDADANDKCDKCDANIAPEVTTAPATEEKKGCGGTVGVAGLALVAALGSCALFVEKKRK